MMDYGSMPLDITVHQVMLLTIGSCSCYVTEVDIFKPPTPEYKRFKATWSIRGFLFLLQNHVNQYKL